MDMIAADKPALSFVWFKFGEAVLQFFFFKIIYIERTESRCVHNIGIFTENDQLGMSGRVFSSCDLSAYAPRLHPDFRLKQIDQG